MLTQGVYDMWHVGHGRYLAEASSFGDVLIVGVDSDELTRKMKGNGRPFDRFEERTEVLAMLSFVHVLTRRDVDQHMYDLIKLVKPDAARSNFNFIRGGVGVVQGPRGLFQDLTAVFGLVNPAWRGTGFGTVLADFDHDGWPDLAFVNGLIERGKDPAPRVEGLAPFWFPYAQRFQLFRNTGAGRFAEIVTKKGGEVVGIDLSRQMIELARRQEEMLDLAEGHRPILRDVQSLADWMWYINTKGSLAEAVAATSFGIEGIAGDIARKVTAGVEAYRGQSGGEMGPKTYKGFREHAHYDDDHPKIALEIVKRYAVTERRQTKAMLAAKRSIQLLHNALLTGYQAYSEAAAALPAPGDELRAQDRRSDRRRGQALIAFPERRFGERRGRARRAVA